jgi:hypothetical protein
MLPAAGAGDPNAGVPPKALVGAGAPKAPKAPVLEAGVAPKAPVAGAAPKAPKPPVLGAAGVLPKTLVVAGAGVLAPKADVDPRPNAGCGGAAAPGVAGAKERAMATRLGLL